MHVDELFAARRLDEIAAKRFPHKRAFVLDGLLVELVLVRRDERGPYTMFWDRLRHDWPPDLLASTGRPPFASSGGVLGYRRAYPGLQAST